MFKSFLTSFFLAFVVLSFVLTIALLVQIVEYVLRGLPMDLVWSFALVSFPETMQWTMPLALLSASVLVFSRLSADSEIAAMRACGVNLMTVMRWPIFAGVLCTAIGLYINNEIVPRGHEVRRTLKQRISVGAGLDLLEPGRTIDDFPNIKLYFERKNGNCLEDLVVVDYTDKKVDRTVTAAKAFVTSEGKDIHLDFHDVSVLPLDAEHPGVAHFRRLRHVIKDALKDSHYSRRAKDYSFSELVKAVRQARKNVRKARRADYSVNAKDAKDEKERVAILEKARKAAVVSARRYESDIKTELQKRLVFAFASICFVLVGVPLGIRAQRRESTIGMAVSIAVALVYYMLAILAMSMAKNYHVHPEILMWLPVAICGGLSMYLVPKNL